MNNSCVCGNIVIRISGENGFSAARRCGCEYCMLNAAEYVSDPNISIVFSIVDHSKHKVIKHGHETAVFHECVNCGLILVTSDIDGQFYCILNAKKLNISGYNLDLKIRDFSGESIQERLARRKCSWSPVCKVS